jgi:excinuclease ABC subunit B
LVARVQKESKEFMFQLKSTYSPSGDQPQAIEKLVSFLKGNNRHQTLLGVTGSGKTFTIANVIAQLNRPALLISHNKTLAAQLYEEMQSFFPENAVEFFISYYDYYQPEAYIPSRDLYIEKTAQINKVIDQMRHSATRSVLTRRDVIVVASVSAIYGLAKPENYLEMSFQLQVGQIIDIEELLKKLVYLNYQYDDLTKEAGTFRQRGEIVEIYPSWQDEGIRVEFFDDEIEALSVIDKVSGQFKYSEEEVTIFAANHYATSYEVREKAIESIEAELEERYAELLKLGKELEAKRLKTRTLEDIALIKELGYCPGIENYSRHLDGRSPGEPPATLLSYFSEDFITFIDESHVTIPQLRGMYRGDRSRKTNLVEHGFRLPSALDNRPLRFSEFMEKVGQLVYVSATPNDYELNLSQTRVAEQIVRPTGLLDPEVEIHPREGQIDYLHLKINEVVEREEAVLITTLTKKMAERLTQYLLENGFRAQYLHSEIDTMERVKIINQLREGEIDIIVGVNLLREGLDIPEVSLVAVFDADKEGFLRSRTSLIQVAGRAARNVNGKVIFFADEFSRALREAVEEMERRRKIQLKYNQKYGIIPQTVKKPIRVKSKEKKVDMVALGEKIFHVDITTLSYEELLYYESYLKEKMTELAERLEFEAAAIFRDKLRELRTRLRDLK